MAKLRKNDMDFCLNFINKIKDYCKVQEDFYNKIAQNNDHSEDFVNRMTDMATSFHSVVQYIDICAESAFNDLLTEPLGDSNEQLGQVEQLAQDESTSINEDIPAEN